TSGKGYGNPCWEITATSPLDLRIHVSTEGAGCPNCLEVYDNDILIGQSPNGGMGSMVSRTLRYMTWPCAAQSGSFGLMSFRQAFQIFHRKPPTHQTPLSSTTPARSATTIRRANHLLLSWMPYSSLHPT